MRGNVDNRRFLVLVMDGLRPDLVTHERMPRLSAFRDSWSVAREARAQYPTVTRVNKVSFATGATPGEHGVWYNGFYDPSVYPDRKIDLSVMSDVLESDEIYGRLIQVPTIGEYLARAGRRFIAIHTASAGASWLVDYRGDKLGHAHYSFAGEYSCFPRELVAAAEQVLGPQPQAEYPNLPQLEYAFDLFVEVMRPRYAPEVSVIWLGEPDKSLHRDGIDGPLTTASLEGLDRIFGRAHDWWAETNGKGEEEWQLVVLSDHGHSTRCGRFDVARRIRDAGFDLSERPTEDGPYLSTAYPCAVYSAGDDELVRRLAGWLQQQEWVGHLFTPSDDPVYGSVPGTFSYTLVGIDNSRLPDLVFSLRGDDEAAPSGYDGRFHTFGNESDTPSGTGHGGLTQSELRTVLFAGGSCFAPRRITDIPASISDVTPTLLACMGLQTDHGSSGRVLSELLSVTDTIPEAPPRERHVVGNDQGYSQTIEIARVGARSYVTGGTTAPLSGSCE